MIKTRSQRTAKIFAFAVSLVCFANFNVTHASTLTSENVVTLINQSRAENGESALTTNSKLSQAAEAKANDMIAKQYFDHVGPDGNGPEHWFALAGYDWTYMGENIAYGYDTAEKVHNALMASPGHRANILGANYKDVGVAAVSGKFQGSNVIMVVEEFGTSRSSSEGTGDQTAVKNALTVNGGTGSGSYGLGAKVAIAANAPAEGKVFDKWTGDITYVSNIYSANATVNMPNKAVTLTATYKDKAATTYALTIVGGTGSGKYAAGEKVTIAANAPLTGITFNRWMGDTSCLSSTTSSTATVTMPSSPVVLVATYKSTVSGKYALTVADGTGGGAYVAGAKVTIVANAPAEGKVFDKWTGDVSYLSDASSATAVVTMPAKGIAVTATYKDGETEKYALTVTDGTGSGDYAANAQVTITANAPAEGKVFDKWTGDVAYISNPNAVSTKVTMPAKDIKLVATYKDKTTATYPDGTLIKIIGSPKVYIIINGCKKWISTPEMFEQMGCKWGNIKIILATDLQTMPDTEDNLIREAGDFKVYIVINGFKRHIPNPSVFQDYGFNWGDVKDVSKDVMDKYKDAYLVRETGRAEVYVIDAQGDRKLIPNPDAFKSLGAKWEDVQIISKAEMNSCPFAK